MEWSKSIFAGIIGAMLLAILLFLFFYAFTKLDVIAEYEQIDYPYYFYKISLFNVRPLDLHNVVIKISDLSRDSDVCSDFHIASTINRTWMANCLIDSSVYNLLLLNCNYIASGGGIEIAWKSMSMLNNCYFIVDYTTSNFPYIPKREKERFKRDENSNIHKLFEPEAS